MVECEDDTLASYSEDEKEMEKAERAVEWKMAKMQAARCQVERGGGHQIGHSSQPAQQLSSPNPQDGEWRGSQAHVVSWITSVCEGVSQCAVSFVQG